jgi:hypothetical protein
MPDTIGTYSEEKSHDGSKLFYLLIETMVEPHVGLAME